MTRRRVPAVRAIVAAALALVVGLTGGRAFAHRPSDSYLRLTVEGARIDARWDLALRDLDYVLGLDADGDGGVTGRELAAGQAAIAAYALGRLAVTADGAACTASAPALLVASHSDGAYAVLRFQLDCPAAPRQLSVDDRVFFDVDPQHRGLFVLNAGGHAEAAVFRADAHALGFTVAGAGAGRVLAAFVEEGVLHIFGGIDHILFLLALLLPCVLRREDGRWVAARALGPVLTDVLRVVTAFTAAHSITLGLSAAGVVTLPSRFVETAIAVTVLLAALNNLWPVFTARWSMAFALGLLHGFGFSSVLADLGVASGHLALTLFGFNLGVEIGQAAIVLTFIPLAFLARRSWAYRRLTLQVGSTAIGVIATVWAVQRFMT